MKDQTENKRTEKRERIEEALRRANWDATKGPIWMRSGRFKPEPDSSKENSSA